MIQNYCVCLYLLVDVSMGNPNETMIGVQFNFLLVEERIICCILKMGTKSCLCFPNKLKVAVHFNFASL